MESTNDGNDLNNDDSKSESFISSPKSSSMPVLKLNPSALFLRGIFLKLVATKRLSSITTAKNAEVMLIRLTHSKVTKHARLTLFRELG